MMYPLISGDIAVVSLFTREWIEILAKAVTAMALHRLPLYEGVD